MTPSGSLSPFRKESGGRLVLVPLGIGVSLVVHSVAAAAILSRPNERERTVQWVEMVVAQPPPPPAPPPPPPPPEKKKPPVVKFEDIKPVDVPTEPPPELEAKPARRVVQGLHQSSFANGSGTGLQARAGNSTRVAAEGAGMSADEATAARSYASVTTPPVSRARPMMEVPKEAQEAGVEGEVRVSIDIGAEGNVTAVRVLRDLGHGTGEACAAAWRQARFTPGKQDGRPVAVTGVPQVCTIRIEQ